MAAGRSRSRERPRVTILWEEEEELEEGLPHMAMPTAGQGCAAANMQWCEKSAEALTAEYTTGRLALLSCQESARQSMLLLPVEEQQLILAPFAGDEEPPAANKAGPVSASRIAPHEPDNELCSDMERCSLAPPPDPPESMERHLARRMGALTIAPSATSFACPKCGHVFGLRRTRDVHKVRCTG